jgi:predicted TIM-barrel fold metal-dependent hydrolase
LDLSFTKTLSIDETRAHNDYSFEVQRSAPDVIFGHWLQFDPRRSSEAVAEFERARAAEAGFVGFGVNGQSTGIPASDPLWDPIYKASLDANVPVMIHTGLTAVGQGLPGGRGIVLDDGHPRHIDAVAARYPDLKVLAARPAYPWQDEMIAILLHKANVMYELHGWGPKHFPPALKREIQGRLQDRIVFGCDFPFLRYEELLASYRKEGYSDEVLHKLMHLNAEAYFPNASWPSSVPTPASQSVSGP